MRVPALLRDISTAALQRESGLHGLIAYESKVFHMNARIPVATSLKKKGRENDALSTLCSYMRLYSRRPPQEVLPILPQQPGRPASTTV